MMGLIDHGVIAMALYVLNSLAVIPSSLNTNGTLVPTKPAPPPPATRPLRMCCITTNASKNSTPNAFSKVLNHAIDAFNLLLNSWQHITTLALPTLQDELIRTKYAPGCYELYHWVILESGLFHWLKVKQLPSQYKYRLRR